MNRTQAQNYVRLLERLGKHGVDAVEVDKLLRCERVLATWSTHECNGAIQRDGDNGDGVPYWYNTNTGAKICRTADREAGALKRATAIAKEHGLTIYHQGDPRGCSLYIIRPGDVPAGKCVTGCYTNGIAVCI